MAPVHLVDKVEASTSECRDDIVKSVHIEQNMGYDCPFCEIAQQYPPEFPIEEAAQPKAKFERRSGIPTQLIFSTPDALAFLDIMPMAQGHALLIPRKHKSKQSDMTIEESQSVASYLPILCRSVCKAMAVEDYNILQNNGINDL